MVEYPTIINSSKAPRENCIAFDKLDGSNVRFKWTQKQGFSLCGSRTQLIDETHPHLGEAVTIFNRDYKYTLDGFFRKDKIFRNERQIIVYGELFGKQSFAGIHVGGDPKEVVIFDVLVGHKNWWFVNPKDFVKTFGGLVKIPKIIYEGNLNDQFIKDVRENKFELNEGVVCKGVTKNGAYRGKVWMAKIKTNDYLDKIKEKYQDKWELYWE